PEGQIGNQASRLVTKLADLLGVGDVAREENDAAEAELAGERLELDRELMPVEPGDEQLTDLAAKTDRRHWPTILPGRPSNGGVFACGSPFGRRCARWRAAPLSRSRLLPR